MSITASDSLAEVRAFIERARERQADNRDEGELRFGHGASILHADTMMDVVERCERAEKDLAALREVVARMQPAVQAVWNFLVAQAMPAWRAVEPILAALDGDGGALHARFACPGWQYTTTEGPRKQWDDPDAAPGGDGWVRNTDAGRDGWERFEYTERSYWRRLIPERERLVHDDPVLAAQIREGIAEAERGESVDLGSLWGAEEMRAALLAVLNRHKPQPAGIVGRPHLMNCSTCRDLGPEINSPTGYPCDEIEDIAKALGVEVGR